MNLIVNVSENWAIGKGNSLLFHLSQDMKFFKSHTTEKTVVMGRKTLESLPGGKPLPNRKNIVLTRNTDYNPDGVTVYNSIEAFLADNADNDDIYVIGGESLYRDLLPYCTRAFVTKVDATVNDADAYMVDLDSHPDWEVENTGEDLEEKGYTFRFVTYKKK